MSKRIKHTILLIVSLVQIDFSGLHKSRKGEAIFRYKEAWRAAIHGIAKNRTQLSD